MSVIPDRPVKYFLSFLDQEGPGLSLNDLLGKKVRLEFTGKINCTHCHRPISKTFADGYCFPCFQRLAQCDLCVLRPELCHFAKGTCREPAWGEANCMRPHYVYLANSSEVKVGLTRVDQIPTRWIDQGATGGILVFQVKTRHQSGVMEVLMKDFFTDKTQWQKMLKNEAPAVDLREKKEELLLSCQDHLESFISQFDEESLEVLEDSEPLDIVYPVLRYPDKVEVLDPAKQPQWEGTLLGMKGQYLILDQGVLNVRKYTGYQIRFTPLI